MLVGCSQQDAPQPGSTSQLNQLTAAVVAQGDVEVVTGDIGPGSTYALYCPASWNGDLVVYAHGYVFPFAEVELPNIDELRDGLLAMGYGVAYSSYSENGFSVKEGVTATRQLRGLYASNFGMPQSTFVMGHSMGGLITVMLTERNPNHYVGALPMCGIVGGSQMAVDHVFTVRALFDFFYPGVIPGTADDVPDSLDPGYAAFGLALNAMLANPFPAFELAAVEQADLRYNDPNELIESILINIFFHVGGFADFFDRTHGHFFFDNTSTVYTGSSDDDALNAGVARFTSTPDARNYLKHWYQPAGNIRIPVLTLHTTRDPLVPFSNESVYEQIVTDAGREELLMQYEVDRFGPCTFTTEEMLAAFQDLVDWSESLVPENAIAGP
jgi:pimeloyl-ACP methyl ester carboxylesterase